MRAADDRVWDATLALNLTAPSVMAQRAAPALRAARGSIVLVTCTSRLAPYRGYLAYQVSKAALHQLMRLLALELAPDVRVNAVAPGSVLPPDEWDAQRVAELTARIPLRRTRAGARSGRCGRAPRAQRVDHRQRDRRRRRPHASA